MRALRRAGRREPALNAIAFVGTLCFVVPVGFVMYAIAVMPVPDAYKLRAAAIMLGLLALMSFGVSLLTRALAR